MSDLMNGMIDEWCGLWGKEQIPQCFLPKVPNDNLHKIRILSWSVTHTTLAHVSFENISTAYVMWTPKSLIVYFVLFLSLMDEILVTRH